MDQQTIRLVLELIGQGKIAEATAELEKHKNKVKEVKESYDLLERQVGEYHVALGGLQTAEDERVRKAVEQTQAQKAMNQILAESAEQTNMLTISARGLGEAVGTQGNNGLGRGMLQASYAVQDFTSQLGTRGLLGALGSVQNNIPILLTSLGAGAGVAGVVSLVAVGLGVAVDNMGKFGGASRDVADALKKVREEADRLASGGNAEAEKTSKDVGAYARQFNDGRGGNTIRQGIESYLQSQALDLGANREALQLKAFGVVTETQQQFVERTAGERSTEAERIFGRLPTDASARMIAARMAGEMPGAFPAGFGEAMGRAAQGQSISSGEILRENQAASGARREIDQDKADRQKELRKKIEDRRKAAEDQDRQDKMVDRVVDEIAEDVGRSNQKDEAERLRKKREENAYNDRIQAEQERAARSAAERARHDNDPSEQLQRQSAQRLDAASAEAMRQNQQGGYGLTPEQLQQAARLAAQQQGDLGKNTEHAVRLGAAGNEAMRQNQHGGYGFTPEQLQQAARMAASMPGDIGPNVDQTFGAIMQAMMRQQQQNQALGQQFNQWGQRFQSLPMMSEPWGGAGF